MKFLFTASFLILFITAQSQKAEPNFYDFIGRFDGQYASVGQNGLYGFINGKGELKIPVIYHGYECEDLSPYFRCGLIPVKQGSKWGVIDSANNILVPFKYEWITAFREYGRYAVAKLNGKLGAFNDKGETILPFMFDKIWRMNGGVFQVERNHKIGYVDSIGSDIIDCKYEDGTKYSEGLIAVKQNNKWGFINKQDSIIIPFIYEKAGFFSEGLSCVTLNGKAGFINKNNEVIIPFIYDDFFYEFKNGYCGLLLNKRYGIINKKGETVIPFIYYYYGLENFRYPSIIVKVNDEDLFDKAKFRILNKDGSYLNTEELDLIFHENSSAFRVMKDKKYGILSVTGSYIIPCIYDDLFKLDGAKLYSVELNNKIGFIDSNNNVSIPFKYDNDNIFTSGMINGIAKVSMHGTDFLINSKDECVVNCDITRNIDWKFPNGKLSCKGKIKNSVKEGRWIYYYETGGFKEINQYKHGLLNGEQVSFSDKGILKNISNYKDGKLHGTSKHFDENGNLTGYSKYKNGILVKDLWENTPIKQIIFFSNGDLKSKGTKINNEKTGKWTECEIYGKDSLCYCDKGIYKNGYKQGVWRHYNEKGKLLYKIAYDKGIQQRPDGLNTDYYPNGKTYAKGVIQNNKEEGQWVYYDNNGNLTSELNYLNGQQSGIQKYYSPDGTRIEENYSLIRVINDSLFRIVDNKNEINPNYYYSSMLNGPYKEYYKNGLVKEEGNYEIKYAEEIIINYPYTNSSKKNRLFSLKDGFWKEYYKNGHLIAEGEYLPKISTETSNDTLIMEDENGLLIIKVAVGIKEIYKKNKTWYYYTPEGALIRKEEYENGELIKTIDY